MIILRHDKFSSIDISRYHLKSISISFFDDQEVNIWLKVVFSFKKSNKNAASSSASLDKKERI